MREYPFQFYKESQFSLHATLKQKANSYKSICQGIKLFESITPV
jgi:hypothetical protein